jgi:hypothetical protein
VVDSAWARGEPRQWDNVLRVAPHLRIMADGANAGSRRARRPVSPLRIAEDRARAAQCLG